MWDNLLKFIKAVVSWPTVAILSIILFYSPIKSVLLSQSGKIVMGPSGLEVSVENILDKENNPEKEIDKIIGEVFHSRTVDIDNKEFINCKFINSTLRYSANGPFVMTGSSLEGSKFSLAGPASTTLKYLSEVYQGFGSDGKQFIEDTFENIRQGVYRTNRT